MCRSLAVMWITCTRDLSMLRCCSNSTGMKMTILKPAGGGKLQEKKRRTEGATRARPQAVSRRATHRGRARSGSAGSTHPCRAESPCCPTRRASGRTGQTPRRSRRTCRGRLQARAQGRRAVAASVWRCQTRRVGAPRQRARRRRRTILNAVCDLEVAAVGGALGRVVPLIRGHRVQLKIAHICAVKGLNAVHLRAAARRRRRGGGEAAAPAPAMAAWLTSGP